MDTIPCQALYDRREQLALISGMDLHDLFTDLLGDPSPAGRRTISVAALRAYATQHPYYRQLIADVLDRREIL